MKERKWNKPITPLADILVAESERYDSAYVQWIRRDIIYANL